MSGPKTPRHRAEHEGADHEGYDELAVGWALHALEPADEDAFALHLSGCARCTRTVADTSEVMGAMATDLPPAEPSEGLRERLRAAVAETTQVARTPGAVPQPQPARPREPDAPATVVPFPDAADREARRPRWRRAVPNALVAAGVAAILALGAWNVVLTQDRDAAEATAASQEAVMGALLSAGQVTMAPMVHNGATVATVVARDGQVQVVTEQMGTNDTSSSTYVLWGLTEGSPVALGTFDVVASGMDLRTVGSEATGLDDYTAYAISLEPGRAAPSEPTDVVAHGQVTS